MCRRAAEPQAPRLQKALKAGACALQQEKAPRGEAHTPQLKWPLLATAREGPHSATRTSAAKKELEANSFT